MKKKSVDQKESSKGKPICKSCGHSFNMIKHSNGIWVCHGTHRREDKIRGVSKCLLTM